MHLQLKLGVASALDHSGFLALLRRSRAVGGLILTFHRVLEAEKLANCYEPHIALHAGAFAELLALLAREYQVLPLEALLAEPQAVRRKRPRVALTFDDGWEDTCSVAAPLLARYSMPATVFLCSALVSDGPAAMLPEERFARVWRAAVNRERLPQLLRDLETWRVGDGHGPHQHAWGRRLKRLPLEVKIMMLSHLEQVYQAPPPDSRHFLTWDQARGMQKNGISFGSHTARHATLDAEEPSMMLAELAGARRAIEQETGAPCTTLAYPNGAYDARVIEAAQTTGYRYAFTTEKGFVRPDTDPLAIPRLCVGDPVVAGPAGSLHPARTRLYLQQMVGTRKRARVSRRLGDRASPGWRDAPNLGPADAAAAAQATSLRPDPRK